MTVSTPDKPIPEIPLQPSPAQYHRLAREIAAADQETLDGIRVGFLSSFTMDFLKPVLTVEGARAGFGVEVELGDFGQLEQPVLSSTSALNVSPPDVLVLNFQPADVSPDAFDRYYASGGASLGALCDDLIARLLHAARAFRDSSNKPVLIANLALPVDLPLGPFDAGDPNGLTHRLAAKNAELAALVSEEPDLYVWDYAGLVRESGASTWSDERLRMLARVAVASDRQPAMARHLIRAIAALRRRPAKCLVLDLDNTIWGGVVGDDGSEGLHLGDDWPGAPFKAFQRAVLGLRDRGVLLAVSSKNDEEVAAEVFRSHPDMLITWDDLAAVRINWQPKSGNMREIAAELNIGADALVLFDDNPVERAEVRAGLPEAGVIEVPTDPLGYREALLQSGFFDQVGLSSEDLDRAEMYRVERARTTLRTEATDLGDFLVSLDMEATVGVADGDTLPRIAQLIGKTNQFNLTTRRHSLAEVASLADSDKARVGWLRLRDRFGDQGLIAVGIVEVDGDEARLDTFLMSCRVMNRHVEHAFMAYMIEQTRSLGCTSLVGEYLPTAKNHMVKDLLPGLGFAPHDSAEDGRLWTLDLTAEPELWPPHIQRIASQTPERSTPQVR